MTLSESAAQHLGPLAQPVAVRLDALRAGQVIERLWRHDHTLWRPDPTEITDRLGWLHAVELMTPQLPRLRDFARAVAAEGYKRVVLLGMGGSSLAPEVIAATLRGATGLSLTVLDATDPEQVAAIEGAAPLDHTLFIVASKSGTTLETLSHFAYFWQRAPRGAQFVAITDAGSALESLARTHGFREVFLNPSDLGGRYSALTYFGLVPAALVGVDPDALLESAREMTEACTDSDPAANPGAWLGAVLGEGARAGRDQLTLVLPPEVATLGTWLEQLIAESTGKEGSGILPIEGEPLGRPEVYSDCRLFVALGEPSAIDSAALEALTTAGHPVVRLPSYGASALGGEFFRWEYATAIAGHVLGVHPFDQPNVQSAKDATAHILARGVEEFPTAPAVHELLNATQPGDYVAILAYLPRTLEVDARLQRARLAIRDRWRVATTIGYGPRYLHSTGQLHKGGPPNGVFIEVIGDDAVDLEIPGQPFSFGTLKRAQALGDLESLLARGRRVARATLEELDALD